YPEIMPVSMIGAAARHETALNNDGPISDRRTPNRPAPNRPAPNSPAATTCDTHHVGSCAPVRVRTGSRSMAKWIAGANPCCHRGTGRKDRRRRRIERKALTSVGELWHRLGIDHHD